MFVGAYFRRGVGFLWYVYSRKLWGCDGLVISPLDFRSGGQWFEPSLCRHVVAFDTKLYFSLSLFTQVYKWVPAIIMLGGNLAMD